MRLGVIEVSGIRNVVFYKRTEWIRESTRKGRLLMRRKDGKKVMPYEKMVALLQEIAYDEYRDIWVEGDTINVKRLTQPKFVETKFDDDGNLMKRDPDGRWKDFISVN